MITIKVTQMRPLGDNRFHFYFSDGSNGISDMSDDVSGETATLETGNVIFHPSEKCFANEYLYSLAHGFAYAKTGEEVTRQQMIVKERMEKAE